MWKFKFGASSTPSTPSTSSSSSGHQRASDFPQTPSQGQPSPPSQGQPSLAEVAGVISHLQDKSIDELRRLLSDKEAYNSFFHSLEPVRIQNDLRNELQKETLQLASENLDKESYISELRNQCTIIRTTELTTTQAKLADLERRKEETLRAFSPLSLLQKLHDSMEKVEEESEALHRKLLEKEIDLPAFVQKHKNLRTTYHNRALTHLAAKMSVY